MRNNLTDCVLCEGHRLLCFFADEKIKICDLSEIQEDGVDKVLKNRQLYESGQITAGGYAVTFNDSIDVPAGVLYKAGVSVPLKPQDFLSFAKNNLPDTTERCTILQCSRQNLAYLAKKKQLSPIREVRGTLYGKGDILKNTW